MSRSPILAVIKSSRTLGMGGVQTLLQAPCGKKNQDNEELNTLPQTLHISNTMLNFSPERHRSPVAFRPASNGAQRIHAAL